MHGMAIVAVAAFIVVLGAVALQLGLPRLAERKAAQRLTESGGHARVHLKAFPATDLLRKRGDSLVVKASGLVATKGEGPAGGSGLESIAGFDHVDIQVIGVKLGPVTVSRLHLERPQREADYEVTLQATVTGADLATFVGGRIGGFLSAAVVGSSTEIPLDVRATLSAGGKATNVSGSLAGLPAGPLVEALTAALATRF
jgi:hypothetical protein